MKTGERWDERDWMPLVLWFGKTITPENIAYLVDVDNYCSVDGCLLTSAPLADDSLIQEIDSECA